MSNPFAFLVARGPIVDATAPSAWLRAMLDVEAALANSQAVAGDIPTEAAATIADACVVEKFDVDAIFEESTLGGVPVIGLVERLRHAVGADAAPYVHVGATSQDIMDTAAMLVVGRCSRLAAEQLETAADLVGPLADEHGEQPMIGRTLGQYAVPMTFGNVTSRWRTRLHECTVSLRALARDLPVQLGGPVGDGTSYGADALTISYTVATRLGLYVPPHSWHTQRGPIAQVAGGWGAIAATVSGIATQIVMLTASDVGELVERSNGAGGSSSMPHKHNPVAAISARAAAMQVPGLVATLLHASGGHEFERAAGAWHAEWPALNTMLRATGSAIDWLTTSLHRITVDPERMAANLARAEAERAP